MTENKFETFYMQASLPYDQWYLVLVGFHLENIVLFDSAVSIYCNLYASHNNLCTCITIPQLHIAVLTGAAFNLPPLQGLMHRRQGCRLT